MSVALKKTQETEELNTYLKEKAGLKKGTAIERFLPQAVVNDNKDIRNLEAFFKIRQKIQKDAEKNLEANPLDTAMVNAKDDVSAAMQVIQKEKLKQKEANEFLESLQTIQTINSFTQGAVENYTTPALKEFQASIQNEEAFNRIHQMKDKTVAIECDAMAIAYDTNKKTDMIAASQQIQNASFAKKSPEEAVQTHASLDPRVDAVQDLNTALQAVAMDGQEPTDVLDESLIENASVDVSKTFEEARNDGDRIYIVDQKGQYHIGGDVETIKTLNEVSIDETVAKVTEFHDAMPELTQQAFNRTTKEGLDVVKKHESLHMVGAKNGVGGVIYDIKP